MVLESFFGARNIRLYPYLIFFLTVLICAGSIFFSNLMFPAHASVLSVAFVTIGLVPLVFSVLSDEESREVVCRASCTTFFARHFNLILLYVWIFIGIIFSFSVYYSLVSPSERMVVFEEQINYFCSISNACSSSNVPFSITGKASSLGFAECRSNSSTIESCTWFIFKNNSGVLLVIILLSLLYGVGAIFIIAWNASILGVFFGEAFLLGDHLSWFGMFLSMLAGHGPPELFAYVFGALAGAILSAMVAKGEFFTHSSSVILKDVLFLSVLAFFSVAYGAVTEAVGSLHFDAVYFSLGFFYWLFIIVAVFFYGNKRFEHSFAY